MKRFFKRLPFSEYRKAFKELVAESERGDKRKSKKTGDCNE